MTPAQILLVEDSPSDRLLAERAFATVKLPNQLSWVKDGVEALDFLRREGKYAGAPRPDLILLDLNLPRKSGREVLAEVKADASLCAIPVIVLTTSSADEDVVLAYGLHANCLVQKPLDFERFAEVVRRIGEFWFTTVKLPPRE
jgi:CheY-like chemotaxis protein